MQRLEEETHTIHKCGDSPQSLNVTAWMPEGLTQHPHTRIPQSIVAKVQFSEVLVGA